MGAQRSKGEKSAKGNTEREREREREARGTIREKKDVTKKSMLFHDKNSFARRQIPPAAFAHYCTLRALGAAALEKSVSASPLPALKHSAAWPGASHPAASTASAAAAAAASAAAAATARRRRRWHSSSRAACALRASRASCHQGHKNIKKCIHQLRVFEIDFFGHKTHTDTCTHVTHDGRNIRLLRGRAKQTLKIKEGGGQVHNISIHLKLNLPFSHPVPLALPLELVHSCTSIRFV